MSDVGSWVGLAGLAFTLVTAILGIGSAVQKNRRTSEDLRELKAEHGKEISDLRSSHGKEVADVRALAGDAHRALDAYKLEVRDRYVIKGEMEQVETRLSGQIAGLKVDVKTDMSGMRAELVDKVDQIRVEVSRKGIEHAIKNAVASALAGVHLSAKSESKP